AELQRYDAGYGDSIPRLSDVLAEFHCTIHVEVKERGIAGEIAAKPAGNITVSAFDWDELAPIASRVPVALLAENETVRRMGAPTYVAAAKQIGAHAIHPHHTAITRELVEAARNAKLQI